MPNSSETPVVVDAETLKPHNTVHDALDRMGDRYGAIICVVNERSMLCGVVSPGDLRKQILNGHSVNTPLESVMNRSPVTIRHGDLGATDRLNTVLENLKHLYNVGNMLYATVPVIGPDDRLVGVVSLQTLARNASDLGFSIKPRSVLVIGGAGFIGSVLTRQLMAEGWTVSVLDNFLYGQDSLSGLEGSSVGIIKGDVKNIDTIVEAVEGVDAVVYLAELVGDPAVALAPQTALKTNYLAVTTLANLCAYLNINRFVYTSSCSVYGASREPDVFLKEESPTAPVTLYGKIKLLVEEAVLAIAELPNPLFAPTILRLGTVFGHSYRSRFDLVVNTFVKESYENGRIELFGGNQWRPQVHVGDVARAIVSVLDAPLNTVRSQVFNVGSTEQNYMISTLADFAQELFPNLEVIRNNAMVDARNYRVNCDKFRDVLGYETKTSVLDGMRELKEAIESGRISDPDQDQHSNFKAIRGLSIN